MAFVNSLRFLMHQAYFRFYPEYDQFVRCKACIYPLSDVNNYTTLSYSPPFAYFRYSICIPQLQKNGGGCCHRILISPLLSILTLIMRTVSSFKLEIRLHSSTKCFFLENLHVLFSIFHEIVNNDILWNFQVTLYKQQNHSKIGLKLQIRRDNIFRKPGVHCTSHYKAISERRSSGF